MKLKVYKCLVRRTETAEAVTFMIAPDVDVAKDPVWLDYAESCCENISEEFQEWKTTYEVISASEVINDSDVPLSWLGQLPWYHPQYEPSEDVEVGKMLVSAEPDEGAWAVEMLAILEKKMGEIEKKMESLQKLTPSAREG